MSEKDFKLSLNQCHSNTQYDAERKKEGLKHHKTTYSIYNHDVVNSVQCNNQFHLPHPKASWLFSDLILNDSLGRQATAAFQDTLSSCK